MSLSPVVSKHDTKWQLAKWKLQRSRLERGVSVFKYSVAHSLRNGAYFYYCGTCTLLFKYILHVNIGFTNSIDKKGT